MFCPTKVLERASDEWVQSQTPFVIKGDVSVG